MLSTFMGPYSFYLSLVYWVYPFKDYIGDAGCYIFIYARVIGNFIIQLHSFFLATFRYVCLFHDNFLLKFNLSPNVSSNDLKGRASFSQAQLRCFSNMSQTCSKRYSNYFKLSYYVLTFGLRLNFRSKLS